MKRTLRYLILVELHNLFAVSIIETFLWHGSTVEAMEDIALVNAIAEGENTEPVSREAIFKILSQQS